MLTHGKRRSGAPWSAARIAARRLSTLGDSGDARVSAERTINSVKSDLMRINRSSLQPGDLTVYDQANSFIDAARKAMASKDYAAAAGFAEKASALTTKLAPNAAVH